MAWSKAEYIEYLLGERRRFAWVRERYAALTPEQTASEAEQRYPYEPSDARFRGLIFHDEAWHWAMLEIYGERYTAEQPRLRCPPPEYKALE